MNKIDLESLFKLVDEKYEIDIKRNTWYKGFITYFQGLKDEVIEVEDELKPNNSVYLEDELGDILWTYLNVLKGLEADGYITSQKAVFEKCFKKYSKRIDFIKKFPEEQKSPAWKEIKNQQKEQLKKEHNLKYN